MHNGPSPLPLTFKLPWGAILCARANAARHANQSGLRLTVTQTIPLPGSVLDSEGPGRGWSERVRPAPSARGPPVALSAPGAAEKTANRPSRGQEPVG